MTEYPSNSQIARYENSESTHGITILDGCSEFPPGGCEGMFCTACNCHGVFHRREEMPISDENESFWPDLWDGVAISNGKESFWEKSFWLDVIEKSPSLSPPQPPPLAAEASSEAAGAKRKRTKFTEEQLAKMKEFAQDSGWRTPKRDRARINKFCQEIGVQELNYKIWVKNKKAGQRKSG